MESIKDKCPRHEGETLWMPDIVADHSDCWFKGCQIHLDAPVPGSMIMPMGSSQIGQGVTTCKHVNSKNYKNQIYPKIT